MMVFMVVFPPQEPCTAFSTFVGAMKDNYRCKCPGAQFQREVDKEKTLKDVDSGKVKHPFFSSRVVITFNACHV